MSGKINLVKKHSTVGSQFITIDTTALEMLGVSDAEGIEEKLNKKIEDGYYIFEYKGVGKSIYYCSKVSDGYVRDLDAYLEDNEWNKNIKIFNAEPDPLVWNRNVDRWIEEALKCEDFVSSLNSLCEEALNTPPKNGDKPFSLVEELTGAKKWLKDQQPTKRGSTGRRPVDITAYLIKSNTGYLPRSAKAFLKWNGSKGGWSTKKFWK